MGIPAYGRSFTLVSATDNGLGAAARGGGTRGQYTGEAGTGYHFPFMSLSVVESILQTLFIKDCFVMLTKIATILQKAVSNNNKETKQKRKHNYMFYTFYVCSDFTRNICTTTLSCCAPECHLNIAPAQSKV